MKHVLIRLEIRYKMYTSIIKFHIFKPKGHFEDFTDQNCEYKYTTQNEQRDKNVNAGDKRIAYCGPPSEISQNSTK